jgi:hypothetical protein
VHAPHGLGHVVEPSAENVAEQNAGHGMTFLTREMPQDGNGQRNSAREKKSGIRYGFWAVIVYHFEMTR